MKTSREKPLILVDGSSYLYRAFHALPPLMNTKNEPTGAIYGVVNMLRKLQKDYPSDHIAVIFDAKGKTFRDDMFAEYKANRPPMPVELQQQIEPLHAVIKAMGLPLLVVKGVEADDVIGTLAEQADQQQQYTLISTVDKDLAQLVNERITLINTMTDKLMDPDGVVEKFGVPPKLMIDYLSLVGDSVDNVPGVEKVGPKTAVKWLDQHKTLDQIMKKADEFTGKVSGNLRKALGHLPLTRELVTIKRDVDLELKVKDLCKHSPDKEKLIELFKQLEFKSWLSDLLDDTQAEKVDVVYDTVLDEKSFNTWLGKIKKAKLFAFDTETTSLDYMQARLVGVSISIETHHAAYIPFAHDYPGAPTQLSQAYVLKHLKPLLEDPHLKKIGHNLKYDMSVLANHNINLQGIEFDTMLESYVYQSTGSRHDMNTLALRYLGYRTIHFEDVAGKGAKQIMFNQVALEDASPYAAEDADITLQLHQKIWSELSSQEGLKHIFTDIEIPLLPVLSRIERHGALINAEKLNQQSEELAESMAKLEEEAYQIAKKTFNLRSTKELQTILFDELKLPILQKTPKGQASTAESVLQELAHDYPLPNVIMQYRTMSKLKSTYTDKLPLQINPETGRVHTSYHQAVTATGRLSSSDPNLQNIPIRTEEGRRIRKAFTAPEGCKIVSADYSQIELRIMAHLSQDEGLLAAFANGLDIHRATAAEVFGTNIDEVSNDQRRSAKAINFGLIYGMSAFGLAKQLGIERKDAQEYVNLYFHRYPRIKEYMENTRELAKKQGYVETFYGRRLYLPEINAGNRIRQQAAERTAINAPMQGTAADIIKKAMIKIDQWLQEQPEQGVMIMQVHDELVFEVPNACVDEAQKKIVDIMCHTCELSVPMTAAVGVGDNWDEAH